MAAFIKHNLKYILIIVSLVFLIYANTLHNDFLSDDLPTIVNNPLISQPLGLLSIASFTNSVNYLIGGFNPFGYHLLNIILHALNSVMVFLLLRLFFKAVPSLWGALIFAAHPAQVEAVAWVSSRLYLLFTFFLLLSFFLYLSATTNKKGDSPLRGESPFFGRYACSLILYTLALLTSFFPLAFAPLIALYDIIFGRWRKTWKLWPAFFMLSAVKILLMLTIVQQRAVEIAIDSGVRSWSNPFFNLVYSFFAHLWLVIWPAKLTIYHEPSVISSLGLKLEIFLFFLILFSLPLLYKKAKPVFFAACLYILFLCPTYSPVMIAWLVAERYLYFAMISFSIIAAFLIDRYLSGSKIKAVGYILLAVLIGTYVLRSVIRNRDWRTHSSLWKATGKISPQSPKAHNNMGDVYSLEGDWNKATAEFQRAIELKPDYAEAYHNLGNSYLNLGRIDEAALVYQQAVAFKPSLYQSHANLGFVYLQKGQRELARQHLEIAARLAPDDRVVRDLLKQAQ
ncbi:MAG: tetratricopeptide repeat protein [Candidatus Omnitrophota bacterium]